MRQAVRYEREGPVAWVTIDSPEARNALGTVVRTGLWDAAHRFNADSDAKVLVLTGVGERAFCAGADLREMADAELEVPPPDFFPVFGQNIESLQADHRGSQRRRDRRRIPAGADADLCVAADHARFAITEAKVGRGTPWAAPLPWSSAPRLALELLLAGEPLDAERRSSDRPGQPLVPAADLTRLHRPSAGRRGMPLSVVAAKRTVYLSRPDVFAEADRIWDPVYRSSDGKRARVCSATTARPSGKADEQSALPQEPRSRLSRSSSWPSSRPAQRNTEQHVSSG